MNSAGTSFVRRRTGLRALPLILCVAAGCATVGVAPDVDLEAPGWTVRTGQSLWKRGGDQPPLAGEVIVARHDNGDVLVSFSKPPLPIFTARTIGETWRIDFVDRGRSFEWTLDRAKSEESIRLVLDPLKRTRPSP